MKNYLEEYKKWCESPDFDEETKKELLEIKDDEKEIEDRFYKELEFGTAGLRGVIGAGTNRMNKYTVGKATQGLANYILEQGTQDKGVAITFELRRIIYIKQPKAIAKSINSRISPLLKIKALYNIVTPVMIQKMISSIYVNISFVFIVFLNILNISNKIPMIMPFIIKTANI